MSVRITFRKIEGTPAIEAYVRKKTDKVFKLVTYPMEIHVILSVGKVEHRVEIASHAEHHDLVAKASSDNLYKTIDAAVLKLTNQLKKLREKRKGHSAAGVTGRNGKHFGEDVAIQVPHGGKRARASAG